MPYQTATLGFDTDVGLQSVTSADAEAFLTIPEQIATLATDTADKRTMLLGCEAACASEDCLRKFVEGFGRRAWRRPLDSAETTKFLQVHATNKAQYDADTALRAVIQRFLARHEFVYRTELAGAGTAHKIVALAPFEIASRLSFLLWSSMPDDALLDAAGTGQLSTREQIGAQAARMLAHDKARDGIKRFYAQWLRVGGEAGAKDKMFTTFKPTLWPSMWAESEAFMDHLTRGGGGGLEAFFKAKYSFLDAQLATFYRAPAPAGTGLGRVDLDANTRSGFLTQASFLASTADEVESNPVLRGLFVREQLFCEELGNPPAAAMDFTLPEPKPGVTNRERFDVLAAMPECAGCHTLTNPIGYSFENYDAVGLYRTTDQGRPVNASGEIKGTDVAGTFTGVHELADRLEGSAQVRSCVAKQWFRYGMGRNETAADACSLVVLEERLRGGSFKDLTLALAQTDTFLHRPGIEGDTP